MIYYYSLFIDGSLIASASPLKSNEMLLEKVWVVDLSKRENGWYFIMEAINSGANIERIQELMKTWHISASEAIYFEKATGKKVKFKNGLPYLK
jgi:hypothetical protein